MKREKNSGEFRQKLFIFLSVPCFGFMYVFTSLMVLAGLPFLFLRVSPVVRCMMKFWARGIFIIMGKRIAVSGIENIPGDRHFVLVANHSSLFDIIAIISVIPDIVWFGHERLMKIPVFRRVLILTGYIPMSKATYRNTKRMIESLVMASRKGNIAIFPEGTRTLDGKINDFYRGFIMLLRSSDVDVLPVTLNGFFRLKPKNRYIDFSAGLNMVIHKIIEKEELVHKQDDKIASEVKSVIESAVVYDSGQQSVNELALTLKQ